MKMYLRKYRMNIVSYIIFNDCSIVKRFTFKYEHYNSLRLDLFKKTKCLFLSKLFKGEIRLTTKSKYFKDNKTLVSLIST